MSASKSTQSDSDRALSKEKLSAVAAVVFVAVLGFVVWRYGPELQEYVSTFSERLAERGWIGGVGFTLLGTLWIVLFLPASLIFLVCGAVWGLQWGLLMALAANFLAGVLAFGIAKRFLAERTADRNPAESKLALVRCAVQKEGLPGASLLRFSALPVWAVNYGLGAAGLSWKHYLIAGLAIVPNTWVFVASGHAAGLAAEQSSRSTAEWALLGASIVGTLVVMVLLGRRAKQLLDETMEETEQDSTRSDPA